MKIFIHAILVMLCSVNLAFGSEKSPSSLISPDNCHLAFSLPDHFEYVAVKDAVLTGTDLCYLTFDFLGNLREKHDISTHGLSQEWRAMTDIALTVENIPLTVKLMGLTSADGPSQNGLYILTGKELYPLKSGILHILEYRSTDHLKIEAQQAAGKMMIFVAGNEKYSINFILYRNGTPTAKALEQEKVYRQLFSSIQFLD